MCLSVDSGVLVNVVSCACCNGGTNVPNRVLAHVVIQTAVLIGSTASYWT